MRAGAVATIGLVLALGGCFQVPVTLSPSSKPLSKGKYNVLGETTGRCYGFSLIGIPITDSNITQIARDRAIEAGGGDALVSITGDETVLGFGLFSIYWTTIQGVAVKTTEK